MGWQACDIKLPTAWVDHLSFTSEGNNIMGWPSCALVRVDRVIFASVPSLTKFVVLRYMKCGAKWPCSVPWHWSSWQPVTTKHVTFLSLMDFYNIPSLKILLAHTGAHRWVGIPIHNNWSRLRGCRHLFSSNIVTKGVKCSSNQWWVCIKLWTQISKTARRSSKKSSIQRLWELVTKCALSYKIMILL